MKKILIFLLLCLMLLTIHFCGCDELEQDVNYKYVSVSASAKVVDFNDIITIPGMQIQMEIIKAGAVKKTAYVTTNEEGPSAYVNHKVTLYREQNVKVQGNLLSTLPQEYIDQNYSVYGYQYDVLTWEVVHMSVDWGETYFWTPQLEFIITKS